MEQTLGRRIAEHRRRLNLTQDQLAEKLGITAQAVSKWENDQSCPDITMLPRLAEIFDISIDELLGREAPQKVHEAEVVEEDNGVHVKSDHWSFHWDSGRKHAVLFAVCVLLVGVLSLLSKWYGWNVSFWSILWPTVLVVYGVGGLFPKFSVFHFGMALFGGYSFVSNLGFWHLDIEEDLVFPICVVLFGLGLLIDALRKPKKPRFRIVKNGSISKKTKVECNNENGYFNCNLSFGEANHLVDATELCGGNASVSFGELTIDLSGVETVAPGCGIEANCSFGEIRLLVPRRFRVESHNSTAFGNVAIKGQPNADAAGIIELNANASFGEISVHYI